MLLQLTENISATTPWRSRKISAPPPPPHVVGFWRSRKIPATTPPPTEYGRLQTICVRHSGKTRFDPPNGCWPVRLYELISHVMPFWYSDFHSSGRLQRIETVSNVSGDDGAFVNQAFDARQAYILNERIDPLIMGIECWSVNNIGNKTMLD